MWLFFYITGQWMKVRLLQHCYSSAHFPCTKAVYTLMVFSQTNALDLMLFKNIPDIPVPFSVLQLLYILGANFVNSNIGVDQ